MGSIIHRGRSGERPKLRRLVSAIIAFVVGTTLLSSPPVATPASAKIRTVSDIPAKYYSLYKSDAKRCKGLSWSYVAAIGKLETNHGRSNRQGVHTDHSKWWRAGPMFFKVGKKYGKWDNYGVDGDHNGKRNVYDPDDAIPTLVDFLCAHSNGSNAHTFGTISRAVHYYSPHDRFVKQVIAKAAQYRSAEREALHPSATTKANRAIRTAETQLGTWYLWGGRPWHWTVYTANRNDCLPKGSCRFDCSSLMQWTWARANDRQIPRVANDQYNVGKRVPWRQAKPGDLVFFATNIFNSRTIHHVGMVTGGGMMIEAPHTGAQVRLSAYWGRGGTMPYVVRLT